MLAALRDEALRSVDSQPRDAARLASCCEAALFNDPQSATSWFEQARTLLKAEAAGWEAVLPADDAPLPFFSLVPTLRDRTAFAQVLTGGRVGLAPSLPDCPVTLVKAYFDNAVKGRGIRQLAVDVRCALEGMSVMAITIVRPPPGLPQQVYQWAQERALAASVEVCNPNPGVWLTVSDLVRNIVLAPLLDCQADEMEQILRRTWLPLELRFDSPRSFDLFLKAFVDAAPHAPFSSSAKALFDHAAGAESLLGKCELAEKFRLYGGILAEYEVVAAETSDKLALIEQLTIKLQHFAEHGSKNLATSPREQNEEKATTDATMPPPRRLRCA